jgi:hypothetical protein
MLHLIIACVFSSTKLENKMIEQVLPRSGWGIKRRGRIGEEAQTMYKHVRKC